jgi:phage head maturation protease
MLLQHGGDTVDGRMPVGVWTGMDEDDRGLKLTGKLANTERGRDAYNLLKMKPRSALDGLSFGPRFVCAVCGKERRRCRPDFHSSKPPVAAMSYR